jgi:hypothetical protein
VRVAGLNQDITYWAPAAENQYGVRNHAAPILIKGHWETKNEQISTIGGDLITSRAIVIVDRDVGVDGFLAQGDQTGAAEPTALPEAWEIRSFMDEADLRSCTKVRKAVL